MKRRLKYLIIPFLGLLIGCASGQLKTAKIENDEAIIIARAFIKNNELEKEIDKTNPLNK